MWELFTSDGLSLVLEDAQRSWVMDVIGSGGPPIEIGVFQGYQHTFYKQYTFEPRTIQIDWVYTPKDRAAYYAMRDELMNLLRHNRNADLTLRYSRPYGPEWIVRDILVVPDKLPAWEQHPASTNTRHIQESLVLIAHDPTWFDPEEKTVAIDQTPSAGFGYPFGYPFGYGASGFLSKSIAYSGNAVSYPVISVTGPFTSMNISHITTGAVLYITSPVATGRTLTIDLDPSNLTIEDDLGNNYLNATANSNFEGMALFPDSADVPNGANEYVISAYNYIVGTTTATISYYERYLGL